MKIHSAVVVGILLLQGAAWGQTVRVLPKAVPIPYDGPSFAGQAVTLKFSPKESGLPSVEKASAVAEAPESKPFSDIPSCRMMDRAFFQQPTRAESIKMLSACFNTLSARYDMSIHAADLGAIVFIVNGSDQAIGDFSKSLELRGNEIFGHPARVVVGVAN